MHWTPLTTWLTSAGMKKAVAALSVIGVGFVVYQSRKRYRDHNLAPVTLDPDLDSRTRRVVIQALSRELDPKILTELAQKLGAAGHHETADVVAIRATQVSSVVSAGWG